MAVARAASHGPYPSGEGHGTGNFVTSSFTPTANALLVVAVAFQVNADGPVSTQDAATTLSGGSLTWTKRASAQYPGAGGIFPGIVQIWTAQVGGSPSSMTLTLDCGANSIYRWWAAPYSYTGHDTGSPIGATASGQHASTLASITLGSAPASSSHVLALLYHGGSDHAALSAGTGFTELAEYLANYLQAQTQERTGSTSTSVPFGRSNNDDGAFGIAACAIEIKEASAGPDPRTATANFTEPNETLSSAAAVGVDADAAFSEPNESLSANATVDVTGSAIFTEPNETLSATASHPVIAAAEFTEPDETLVSSVSGATLANADFTEPDETIQAETSHPVVGNAVFAEAGETIAAAASNPITADGAFSEPNETVAAGVDVDIEADADFTEPDETVGSNVDTGEGGFGRSNLRSINIGRVGIGL